MLRDQLRRKLPLEAANAFLCFLKRMRKTSSLFLPFHFIHSPASALRANTACTIPEHSGEGRRSSSQTYGLSKGCIHSQSLRATEKPHVYAAVVQELV